MRSKIRKSAKPASGKRRLRQARRLEAKTTLSSQNVLKTPPAPTVEVSAIRKLTADELRATFDAWATALGKEIRTAQRKYVRNGGTLKGPGELYTAKEFFDGMLGEETVEKIRNLKADADRKEREEAEAMGKLIEWERVENHYNQRFFLPLQSAMDVAPDEVSREWVEKVLKPILRGKVEAPKPEV